MAPLWEGYDEFAHFGVVRAIAARGILLPPRNQLGPRDVEESLKLAPIPWGVHDWDVFRIAQTEEAYWALPAKERRQQEARLRNLPATWKSEESAGGISAYEAYQPPLYYWILALALYLLKNASLLAQVMLLRWIGVAIAAVALPDL